MTSPGFEKI